MSRLAGGRGLSGRGELADRFSLASLRGVRVVVFAAAVSLLATAAAAADDPAVRFVQELGDRTIEIFQGKAGDTFPEREAAFRAVVVEGFDIPGVARFALGRHWKAASEAQREEYLAVFVDFIVRVYASRFGSYGGEQFTVVSSIEADGGDRIARARIQRPGGTPIAVDFRVRERAEGPKIIDVSVEGISMLHTHRVEFASVVNRKGLDGLLADLRARAEAAVDEAK